MKSSLQSLLYTVLVGLCFCACQKIDLTGSDGEDDEETASASDGSSSDDASEQDDDYVSDTADYRGYATLEAYLRHYGTDSLHCIPLIDLLDGGWVCEAWYNGSESDADALQNAGSVWIGAAYIVGYATGSTLSTNTAHFTTSEAVASNVLLALYDTVADYAACVPVQLSTSTTAQNAVRQACNLSDNPACLGSRVKFLGVLSEYFGTLGLKAVTDYVFSSDSVTTDLCTAVPSDSVSDDTTDAADDSDDVVTEDSDAADDTGDEGEAEDNSGDGDDTTDNATTDDDNTVDDSTDEDDATDDDDFNGYGTLDNYLTYYGTSSDVPIPLADCISGGCLYAYYMDGDATNVDNVWVGPGYIVGYCTTSISNCTFGTGGDVRTNVLIDSSPSCTDPSLCMPVNLLTGSSYEAMRNAYNLVDNPDSLGAYVVFYGSLRIKYGTLTLTYVKDAVSLSSDATDQEESTTSDDDRHKWVRGKK